MPNTHWNDSRNWSPEQVPGPDDDVIVPDGLGVPGDCFGATLRSLHMNPTGFLVQGDLTLTQGTSAFGPYNIEVTGVLTVGEAATLIVQGDYNDVSGTDTVVNHGTIVGHDVGYPHPSIGAPVYNHGTVTCDAGTLCLYQGGVSYPGSVIGGGAGIVQLYDSGSFDVDWSLQGGCALVGGVELADQVTIPFGATVACQGANAVDLYGGLFGPGTLRVESGSTLALGGHGSYDAGFTLDNDGTVVVKDCDPYQWHGGTLIDNGGVLHIQTDYNGLGVDTTAGRAVLRNTGTIISDGVYPYIDMALDNRGTISVPTGTLQLNALSNYNAATKTLTGGTYIVTDPGKLLINDADVTTLAANVVLSGAAAKIEDSAARNALRNLASITPAGSLQLLGGQALATLALANQGTVRIGADSSLTTSGPYAQAAGRTTLVAPTSTLASTGAGAAVIFSGGYLYGCGTVSPSLTSSGVCLRPGAAGTPYGTLSVAGPYTQGAAGTLEIDLGGTAAGQYDVLAVTGAATLAGALKATCDAAYVPAKGASFPVLTCGARSGTFLSTGGGKKSSARPVFQFVYSAGGLTLKAT